MDSRLRKRLEKVETQIDLLRDVERRFLEFSAHEKVLYSKLYLSMKGANVEERKAKVYSSDDWFNFVNAFSEMEAEYLEAKRRYELKLKAYDAEHLSFKNELPAIKRQVG